MAQQIINIGSADYAGDGESLRTAFDKANTNFTELYTQADQVQSFDGDYNNLTNKPDLSVYALTANTFNGDYNNLDNLPSLFSGNYEDLANKPSIPSTIDNLNNVNVTSVQDGQVLKFDNTSGSWINSTISELSAGADVYLVDGGSATAIYTNGDLVLDGGSA